MTGFDASGHIAEETKHARSAASTFHVEHRSSCFHYRVVAARGIFGSALATGLCGFVTAILFLFCTPDIDTLFSLNAPQPFVQIYSLALGRGGSVFMTIIAAVGLIMVSNRVFVLKSRQFNRKYLQNTSIAIVAASRLIFAVARDGVLPFSGWIGQVTPDGSPRNAVTVMFVFGSLLLCTILPSQVAFTSLVSAGGVPTIAAYGLIALLRLTMTPNRFKSSYYDLGRFKKLFYVCAAAFNAIVFSVMISPFVFPVTAETFNFVRIIVFFFLCRRS
jgi:hypothetical protein